MYIVDSGQQTLDPTVKYHNLKASHILAFNAFGAKFICKLPAPDCLQVSDVQSFRTFEFDEQLTEFWSIGISKGFENYIGKQF